MNAHKKTREQWLNEVAHSMAPLFATARAELPRKYRVTMSLTKKKKAVGLCFSDDSSSDKTFEILIRIDQDDPITVAAILAHELVHAAVGLAEGHKGEFRRVARAIGLEGKMTATVPGERFVEAVTPLLERAGTFPHAALDWTNSSGPKKQGTRMLKAVCTSCGYTVRLTRKWLDAAGAPYCPSDICDDLLVAEEPED